MTSVNTKKDKVRMNYLIRFNKFYYKIKVNR